MENKNKNKYEKTHDLFDQITLLLNHMAKYGKYPCYDVVCNTLNKKTKQYEDKIYFKCAFCKKKYARYSTLKKHITDDHEPYQKLYDILIILRDYVEKNEKDLDSDLLELFMKVVDNSSFDEYHIIVDEILKDHNLEPYKNNY